MKLLGHLEMTTVDYFVPYYINEQQSEIRGIKRGWYTMDERGELCSGPFLSPKRMPQKGLSARECVNAGVAALIVSHFYRP